MDMINMGSMSPKEYVINFKTNLKNKLDDKDVFLSNDRLDRTELFSFVEMNGSSKMSYLIDYIKIPEQDKDLVTLSYTFSDSTGSKDRNYFYKNQPSISNKQITEVYNILTNPDIKEEKAIVFKSINFEDIESNLSDLVVSTDNVLNLIHISRKDMAGSASHDIRNKYILLYEKLGVKSYRYVNTEVDLSASR
jgi:hypothetical protein